MKFDKLEINPVKTKPKILFLPDEGLMEIQGESYPENSVEFYAPIMNWLKEYLEFDGSANSIQFNFRLNYFNTSSSKSILDILDLLEHYHEKGRNIEVNWYYEQDDEDIQESGEEFAEGLTISFNLIAF